MEVTANNVPVKVESSNGSEKPAKKNGKEEKSRRKDDKSVEQVMKALNVLETTEEKLAAMCKKYTEIVDENRKLQLSAKQWEKGLHSVLREKEQLQTDHSKAVLTRSRLESLCRELQRQNKQIKEESLLKIREEEEKRKEVSAKFNATLGEITSLMTSSNEKTNMLRDENVEITKKFKSICDQNAIQQQQVDKMNTQRKLESELTEARLAKQGLEFAAEKEILLKEKQELFMNIHTLHARVNELEGSEVSLKGQVALYADRYDEFQNALTKSNEVFGGFKGEMEKMSKKITRLEKETSTWKSRWEKSHQSFLEVVAEKSKCEGELALASRKHAQLEKLCRTLQTERVLLLSQIKCLGSSPTAGDGSEDTITAHVESSGTPGSEPMLQSSFTNVEATPEGLHESSKELTAAIESLNLQNYSSNSDQEVLHSDTPDVTNIAQPIDNIMDGNIIKNVPLDDNSIEKSPVCSSGDKSNNQDDVNALTVDNAPSSYVDGGRTSSDAASKTNAGKPAANKQGSKVDARSANKKGVKSRTGVKETQGDKKTKPPPTSDVKKGNCDVSKEKKDKDNVLVLTGEDKSEASNDVEDKKDQEVNDKKDESVKEKKEIDCSNEKQKQGNVVEVDSNKVAELVSEDKRNDSKLQDEEGSNLRIRKEDQESGVIEMSTTTPPLPKDAIVEKMVTPEMNLIKDSCVAVAGPVIEKKDPNQLPGATKAPFKGELEKTAGEADKVVIEKQQTGETQTETSVDKIAEPQPVKDCDFAKEVESTIKAVVECEISNTQLSAGVDLTKVPETNKSIIDSPSSGKKEECKLGDGTDDKEQAESIDVGKKVGDVAPASKPPLHTGESQGNEKKDIAITVNVSEKEKVPTGSEAKVVPKVPGVEGGQVKSTNKPAPVTNKDAKRVKKPEKPVIAAEGKIHNAPKPEKAPVTVVEKIAKTPKPEGPPVTAVEKLDNTPAELEKSLLPELPTENKPIEDRSQTETIPSPAPNSVPPPIPNPTRASESHPPPVMPEAIALPPSPPTAQRSETESPLKTLTDVSDVNQGAKQQSDSKKEKVVAKKRKK